MAWGSNNKSKEEMKKEILSEMFPNKSEQELLEMVKSFDTIKEKAAKVDTLEANLSTATGEVADLKTRLQNLERGRSTNNNNNNNNNSNNNGEVVNDNGERPDWGVDADAAFNDRARPIVALTLTNTAEIILDSVERDLRQSDPLYNTLEKEFKEELKKAPLQARAQKEFVLNCYNVVWGRHRHEILRDQAARTGTYFVETGRNQNTNHSTNNNSQNDTSKILSEQEKKEAAKFGLTDEQWLKTRNAIRFVGGGVQTL